MSVSFPRLEIVLEGELADGCLSAPLGPLAGALFARRALECPAVARCCHHA
jgi:hypothetical protein